MGVILSIDGVKKYYELGGGSAFGSGPKRVVRAVDGVSFDVNEGETVGIVGESGCGKTTLGRLIIALTETSAGKITFEDLDLSNLDKTGLKKLRASMQMVFQDPNASLPPHMTIGKAIMRSAKLHISEEEERMRRVKQVLEETGLTPYSRYYDRFPSQLSGGERQRAVIARALVSSPKFIIADEPVAMLDVSVRAQVIELLRTLKESMHLTMILITHDLSVAGYLCDKIAIMYLGRIVEIGTSNEVFFNSQHPYTVALRSSVPSPDPRRRRKESLTYGEPPSAVDPPPGCHFHPRCPYALDKCRTNFPEDVRFSSTHLAKCLITPFQQKSQVVEKNVYTQ